MKHLSIIPFIILFCMSFFIVSCQDALEELPNNKKLLKESSNTTENSNLAKSQTLDILELEIPSDLKTMYLKEVNGNSGWVNMDNTKYNGKLMITTGSNGYISSIKVKGEITNQIEANYLVTPQKKLFLFCMNDCMRGQPLNAYVAAFCLVACASRI